MTHYDYGARIYNPGIGRFLSVDPLSAKYPYLTPYHFSGNNPVLFADFNGEDFGIIIDHENKTIIIVANIFTVSNLTFKQAGEAAKQWNAASAEIDGYKVSFKVKAIPPTRFNRIDQGLKRLAILHKKNPKIINKKGRFRRNKVLAENLKLEQKIALGRAHQDGGTGNVFNGSTDAGRQVEGSVFTGGFTRNGVVIDMNSHEDPAVGDLGSHPDLVAHEIGHLFGLDDKGGVYFNDTGVMKYKGIDLNPISIEDIKQILSFAKNSLAGKEDETAANVKILQTTGVSNGTSPLDTKTEEVKSENSDKSEGTGKSDKKN